MSDTPADPPGPPPGWYPDPSGVAGSRWWDGTAWADHTRDAGPGDDPPPPPQADPATDAGVPLSVTGRSRTVALVAAAVLAVGLVATAVVGLRTPAEVVTDGVPLGVVLDPDAVPPPLVRSDVDAAGTAAGCRTIVDGEPLADVEHLGRLRIPPAEVLYPDRPAHSGRHHGSVLPLPERIPEGPIDERAVVHNMEHGSVVVWFDPDQVDPGTRRDLGDWQQRRIAAGFTSRSAGGVFVSPMPDDLENPPAVALRAWGVAVDCDRFEELVADGFLVDHWGTNGAAPESGRSPFPPDSLRYAEGV